MVADAPHRNRNSNTKSNCCLGNALGNYPMAAFHRQLGVFTEKFIAVVAADA